MRYVIVDLEGASRDYFDDRQDLVQSLDEIENDHPGITAELFVVAYDAEGARVGKPERADEIRAHYSASRTVRLGSQMLAAASIGQQLIQSRAPVLAGTAREAESE